MRLTAFTDFGLRVLMHLARSPEGGATIAEIAHDVGASEHHLVKVVHVLGKMGVLSNTRGRGGGVRLAAPPASINIGRLVRATETASLVECFDPHENTCPLAGRCGLEHILHEAEDAFYGVLDRFTVEDLVRRPQRGSPMAVLKRAGAAR